MDKLAICAMGKCRCILVCAILCSHIFKGVQGIHDLEEDMGHAASQRNTYDTSLSNVALITDASMTVTEAGQLYGFEFFSEGHAGVAVTFQLWRLSSGTTYTLVHESDSVTVADSTQSQTFSLSTKVDVQSGDTLGIGITTDNPIPYSTSTCGSTLTEAMTSSGTGTSRTFTSLGGDCRLYSLVAKIVYNSNAALALSCTYLTATTSFQDLTSPSYDGSTEYSEDVHQCWVIGKSSSADFSLQVAAFDLEGVNSITGECDDFVNIIEGSTAVDTPLLYEWCGSATDVNITTFTSSASGLYIRMFTNSDFEKGTGFLIRYKDLSSDGNKLNVIAIVLIVLAIVILIVIIAFIIYKWHKVRKQRLQDDGKRLTKEDKQDREMDSLAVAKRPAIAPTPDLRFKSDQKRRVIFRDDDNSELNTFRREGTLPVTPSAIDMENERVRSTAEMFRARPHTEKDNKKSSKWAALSADTE